MSKKFTCETCNESFSITTKSHEPVTFCPFCGDELAVIDDDDDYEDVVDDDDDDYADED